MLLTGIRGQIFSAGGIRAAEQDRLVRFKALGILPICSTLGRAGRRGGVVRRVLNASVELKAVLHSSIVLNPSMVFLVATATRSSDVE